MTKTAGEVESRRCRRYCRSSRSCWCSAFVIAPHLSSILLLFPFGSSPFACRNDAFTLGAELAMSPMGESRGERLTKSRKLPVVIGLSFLLGFIITISEPDLPGSGESGSGCAEHDADLVRSMRSRRISCCGTDANAVLRWHFRRCCLSFTAWCLYWRCSCRRLF